jgi:ribose transport system ATP-binding protein
LGEQCLLLTGGFDISVGSTMSLTVVVASFVATSSSAPGALPGLLVCLAVGIGVGLVNGFIVLVLEVNAIIATIATLGVVSGLAILLRGAPGGTISPGLTGALDHQVGFLPVAFLIVVVLAVIGELWRVRASGGLSVQAVGLRPEAARRSGIRVDLVTFCGYVVCGLCAAIAGVFLSVQVGSGSNAVGQGYALTAFTACFVGGASLAGGRGSFVGTVLGAVFLAMLTNITPLVNIPDATAQIATGAITVVAVLAYSVRRGPTTSRRSTAIGVGVESATAAGEG